VRPFSGEKELHSWLNSQNFGKVRPFSGEKELHSWCGKKIKKELKKKLFLTPKILVRYDHFPMKNNYTPGVEKKFKKNSKKNFF
jgi:hypothetical protein